MRAVKAPKLFLHTGEQSVKLRKKLGLNQSDFWSRVRVTQSGGSRYESQCHWGHADPNGTLLTGDELMLTLDVPYVPAQDASLVLAQAAAASSTPPTADYLMKTCTETEHTTNLNSALRSSQRLRILFKQTVPVISLPRNARQ